MALAGLLARFSLTLALTLALTFTFALVLAVAAELTRLILLTSWTGLLALAGLSSRTAAQAVELIAQPRQVVHGAVDCYIFGIMLRIA